MGDPGLCELDGDVDDAPARRPQPRAPAPRLHGHGPQRTRRGARSARPLSARSSPPGCPPARAAGPCAVARSGGESQRRRRDRRPGVRPPRVRRSARPAPPAWPGTDDGARRPRPGPGCAQPSRWRPTAPRGGARPPRPHGLQAAADAPVAPRARPGARHRPAACLPLCAPARGARQRPGASGANGADRAGVRPAQVDERRGRRRPVTQR